MALDITQSSIGVDVSGMIHIKDAIKLYLIDDSISTVKTNTDQLISNMDNYWHGASANAFAVKVNNERIKVELILKILEAKIERDLGAIGMNVAIADADVAESILSGNIGATGASSNLQATSNGTSNTHIPSAKEIWNSIDKSWDNIKDKSAEYRKSLTEAERIEIDKAWDEAHKESTFDKALRVGGATLTNAAISYTKGVGQFVEDVADTGAIVLTGAASVGTGLYDGVTYVGSKITGSEWHSVTADMWEGTKAYVSKDAIKSVFNDVYDDTNVGIWANRNSIMSKKVRSVSEKAGYVAGMGYATKLLSSSMMGTKYAGSDPVIRKAAQKSYTKAAATIVGGTAGFGKGAEKAWGDGATTGEGLKYAAASGAWGAVKSNVTQELSQALPEVPKDDPFVKKRIKKGVNRVAKEIIKNTKVYADGEVTPLMEKIYKQPGDGLVGVESTRDMSVFKDRLHNQPMDDIEKSNSINVD